MIRKTPPLHQRRMAGKYISKMAYDLKHFILRHGSPRPDAFREDDLQPGSFSQSGFDLKPRSDQIGAFVDAQ